MTDLLPEEVKADAAYRHAAKLIDRGRRAVSEGRKTNLAAVQPAIVALCTLIRDMPAELARSWIERLNVLLRSLHALGAELAAQEAAQEAAEEADQEAAHQPAPQLALGERESEADGTGNAENDAESPPSGGEGGR